MPIIRFFVTEEESERLQNEATAKGVTLAVLARMRILQTEEDLTFSPGEICRRALDAIQAGSLQRGDPWAISDLFTEEEWATLPKGSNGITGRTFFQYIKEHGPSLDIYYHDYDKKRRLATYTVGTVPALASGPIFLPADALDRARQLPTGTRFSLPDLYTDAEWKSFITGHGPAGRAFATHLKKTGVTDIVLVRPSGNGQNALYERI